ncbi:MAG: 16S rRNA processing protein RimM [Acidobacteria bacterium]|nr:MAG: 16S rRNA processing protein RimM [Acidobacteriota bacterium]
MSLNWKKEKQPQKSNLRCVGTISKPHGIHGAFFLHMESDLPQWLQNRESFYVEVDGHVVCSPVLSFKWKQNRPIITLELFKSRTDIESHTGTALYVLEEEARAACDEDFFFNSDLVGLEVLCRNPELTSPEKVGVIVAVHENPAHNQLEIRKESGSVFWLPFVKGLILDIDLEKRQLTAVIPEGLDELS